MNSNTNSLNWFEIPATDIKRAKKFYETVFGIKMELMEMPGMVAAMFPWKDGSGKANGSITKSKLHKPSKTGGCVIYLNADPDLKQALGKVEKAGGKVVMPKTGIGPNGFMAFFIDSEGNRMAMHSNK
ncbi:MAG TPA: VOC family protein [Flavobacteriales bacterium]|nr:VOC family protein [Flavobacteriales bacterium]